MTRRLLQPLTLGQDKARPFVLGPRDQRIREVVGLAAYLASDEVAFLNGANIAINGSQHMY